MRVTIICAASTNNVIGQNNTIPWRDPNDLNRFRYITKRGILIMGRKTYESLPNKKLPGRLHIVITRNPDLINTTIADSEVIAVSSFGEAVATAKLYKTIRAMRPNKSSGGVYVIGGRDIIKAAIPIASRWCFTQVDVVVKEDPTNVIIEPPDPDVWELLDPISSLRYQARDYYEKSEVYSELNVYIKK